MDRGRRAQLSPREAATLLKVANEATEQDQLRVADVVRLQALGLISIEDGGWRLTPAGHERVIQLKRHAT